MFYNCKKVVLTPPKKFIPFNSSEGYKESIWLDGCLENEIKNLWKHGIRTRGCCCGHGKELGYIIVDMEDISKMVKLGYQNYIYDDIVGGHERKDAFIPKTTKHIFDGYTEFLKG